MEGCISPTFNIIVHLKPFQLKPFTDLKFNKLSLFSTYAVNFVLDDHTLKCQNINNEILSAHAFKARQTIYFSWLSFSVDLIPVDCNIIFSVEDQIYPERSIYLVEEYEEYALSLLLCALGIWNICYLTTEISYRLLMSHKCHNPFTWTLFTINSAISMQNKNYPLMKISDSWLHKM